MSSTVAVSGRPSAWGLWVALALSLTLNLFVLGGLGWSMMTHPRRDVGPERFTEIARTLDLDAQQQTALGDFGRNARNLTRGLHEADMPVIRQIWTELGKTTPDMATIQRLNDEVLGHRRDFNAKMAQNLLGFLATLTPDERERFVDSAMEPPGRR